jgi:hypothetical protein
VSDEEIPDEDLAGEDLIALPHSTWEALLRAELTTDLLDAAEIAGVDGACAFLTLRDLEWIGVVA